MTQIQMLSQLQSVDSERLRVVRALRVAESSLGETQELRQAREAKAREEEGLNQWSGRLRDLDLKLGGLGDRIQKTEQRLYGGSVRNPKELGSLQADLEQLRRRRDKAEDDLLEAMTEVDEREARVSEARAKLKQIEERWEAEQDALRDTIARLQEELHDLEQRGRELRSAIDADKLALYDELLRSKSGVAVAVLKGDLCGVCRVRVPSGLAQRVRQGQEMVLCNNCGRILVKG